jgi:hypothetical protein
MYSQAQEQLAITVAVWDLAKIRNLLVFDALVDIEANRVRLIYFRPVVLSFGCRYNRLLCCARWSISQEIPASWSRDMGLELLFYNVSSRSWPGRTRYD